MINTFLYVFCIILEIITICLIVIYSTNLKDHSSFYYGFNCWFTSIMLLDNLLRCLPFSRGDGINSRDVNEEVSFLCHSQAFLLTLFDKLTILSVTVFAIFSYLEKFPEEFLKEKRKKLLIISIIIIIIFSLFCTILFFIQGISDRSQFCYVETKSDLKKWVDSIVTGLFGLFDFAFTILIFIRNKCCNAVKESISLVINLITFIYVIFLINRILPFEGYIKDLIYVSLCLIANLFMVINKEVCNYIKKVFHCDKNDNNKILNKEVNLSENFNDDNSNENN